MPEGASGTLWAAFHARTGGLGNRPGVRDAGGALTFADLWSAADALAQRLRAAGVPKSGTAGLAMRSSASFVTAFLALCRLDATIVLISPLYRSSELEVLARGLGLGAVVTQRDLVAEMAASLPGARAASFDGLEALIVERDVEPAAPERGAVLKLSSGSTAQPKAIVLEADNVLSEARNVTTTLRLGPDDRVLAGVPLFHSYGFDLGVLPALYAGSTLEVEAAFVSRRTLAVLAEQPGPPTWECRRTTAPCSPRLLELPRPCATCGGSFPAPHRSPLTSSWALPSASARRSASTTEAPKRAG
jgi:acyl-CoA synthetase (AMP-forming)/AMP-acid ligase II